MNEKQFDPQTVKYCCGCGEKLYWRVLARYFSCTTGEPYYHYHFKCPNWRFWNAHKHANWKCDEHGSSYAYEA
jgi:hypothetical protein